MSYKSFLIASVIALFSLSQSLFASGKLVHYSSGALTSKSNQIVRTVDCKCNRSYKIILGVVNYTRSPLSLSLRQNNEDVKTVPLDGLNERKEIINFSTLKSGLFSLEVKANFNDADFKFASFDIFIIEEE